MPSRFDPKKRTGAPKKKTRGTSPTKSAATKEGEAKKDIIKQTTTPQTSHKGVVVKSSTLKPVQRDDAWLKVHKAYSKSRSKNLFRGLLLGILSVFIIGLLVVALLPILWSVDMNLTGIVTKFLPESIAGPALPKERINMIALGTGGFENDAPDLTDSIMFISYDNSRPAGETDATMVSIPRDLYVQSDILGYTRINAIYAGVKRKLGHEAAMNHLMEKVSEIVGKPVAHYVMVDFRGFRTFVDRIGGVTVDVPEKVYDNTYPNSTWGYTTFSVEPGIQEFDGEKALRYVRSRHSTSDFDRSKRQQIVISAIKAKLIDEGYLRSPKKIEDLFLTLQDNFQTSLALGEIIQFAALMHDFDSEYQMYSFNLNDTCFESLSYCEPGGLLYAPSRDLVNGQAVLLPNGATTYNVSEYSAIQKFVHLVVSYPQFSDHTREIHIFNATGRAGIAYEFAMILKSFGFNVPEDGALGNADVEDPNKSFLYYDSTLPSDDPTLQALDLVFYGEQIPETLPVFAEVGESTIEIVLGSDSDIFFGY